MYGTDDSRHDGGYGSFGAARFEFPPQSDVIGPPGATAADGAVLKSGRFGTGLNIFISTVGGGIFVVPVLAHHASMVVALVAMISFVFIAVAASRMVALAAGINKSPSYSEVIAIVLVGPDCRTTADESAVGATVMDASAEDMQMLSPVNPNASSTTFLTKLARDQQFRQARRDARARRVYAEYALDALVYLGNIVTCIIYARMIIDTAAPVLRQFDLGPVIADHRFLFAVVFVFATFIGMMRSLREVVVAVAIGCVTIVIPVCALVGTYFVSNGGDGYSTAQQRKEIHWLTFSMDGIAPMLASALASCCYHNVVPQITREMKDFTVNSFSIVAAQVAVVVGVFYVSAISVGYLTFGSAVVNAHGLLLNLYPEHGFWVVMRFFFAVHILCAYPVYLVNTRIGIYRLYFRVAQRLSKRAAADSSVAKETAVGREMERRNASFAQRVEEEEHDDNAVVAPVEVGRTVGYELSALERLGQSLLLAFVAVGVAVLVEDTAEISAWGGTVTGPALMFLLPGVVAMRVYGGLWHGTPWVEQTGEAHLYHPWRAGWWLGAGAIAVGLCLQVIMLLSRFGLFRPIGATVV